RNDFRIAPAATDVSSLSLHDALPISTSEPAPEPKGPVYTLEDGTKVEIDPEAETLPKKVRKDLAKRAGATASGDSVSAYANFIRSEEHTSELQSRENLVCRLLLE